MNGILDLYIVNQLRHVYSPEEAREWIASPQPLLDGAVPRDLIDAGRHEEVLRLVAQIRTGVYV